MSTPSIARQSAPRRYTSATPTGGVLTAAIRFVVAGAVEVAGADPGSGEMIDLAAVFEGLLAFTPWAWATLGTYAVLLTPVAGLLVTAWEYASVGDRRTVLTAVAVLVVLGISALVAILR